MKPTVLPVNETGIPFELTVIPRWILWNYEQTEQGWTKVPRQPNGKKASSARSATWSSFDVVMEAYRTGNFSGIGIVLDGTGGLACVDLDDALSGDKASDFARTALQSVPGYVEVSPGGAGLHIFVNTPTPGPVVSKAGPIEYYSSGRCIAVTGHVFEGRADLNEAPADLAEALAKLAPGKTVAAPAGDDPDPDATALLTHHGPLSDWSIERVEDELLSELDADCSRDEWLQVLMALHHQGDGDHDWLELAIRWSETGGEKFVGEDDVIARWESFQRDAGGVTLASLIKRVNAKRLKDHVDNYDRYRERIEMAIDRKELEEVICVEVRDSDELTPLDKQGLAKLVQQVLKRKFHVDAPISSVRALITAPVNRDSNTPVPLRNMVWVRRTSSFYDMVNRTDVSTRSLDAEFNREFAPVILQGGGARFASASEQMVNELKVPIVHDVMYYPGRPEIFDWDGLTYANSYRLTDMVMVEMPDERGGRAVIDALLGHVAWMFPDPADQRLLLSWLAYIVQHPGERIHWALVLVGGEGTGKTLLQEMMHEVLGRRNCMVLDTGSIVGNFSGWAVGHMLKVVEELKMHGHNRYDAANKLKPLITNQLVSVESKGVDTRTVLNTASYLILTNHIDAIPLSDGDRRYAVLETLRTKEESAVRVPLFREFGRLFRRHPGVVLWWLLGFDDWHPAFEPKGRAPMTEAKIVAIEETRTDTEVAIQEVLERGGAGITATVVAAAYLIEAGSRLIRDRGGKAPSPHAWGATMRSLGWFRRQVWWRQKNNKVWVRQIDASIVDVIDALDNSILDNIASEFDDE